METRQHGCAIDVPARRVERSGSTVRLGVRVLVDLFTSFYVALTTPGAERRQRACKKKGLIRCVQAPVSTSALCRYAVVLAADAVVFATV